MRDAPRRIEAAVAPTAGVAGPEATSMDGGGRPPRLGAGDEQLRAEDIMKRWRKALLPLFFPDPRSEGKHAPVIAARGEGRDPMVDAGAQPACGAGAQQFSLGGTGALDIIIAIDTSGSMRPEIRDVLVWLTEVELVMRQQGVDFQMVVVADHAALRLALQRRPLDGGSQVDAGMVQAPIGSRDALEKLIASAREGPAPRWPELLRTGAAKHVVVVTDDEANDESGLSYLGPLATAAGGLLGPPGSPDVTLHLLGGFEPPRPAEILGPDDPLATSKCKGGEAPGLAYQRLAQATRGLRASLCYPKSYRAFAGALLEWHTSKAAVPCMWLLRPGVDARSIQEVGALGPRPSLRLWEAPGTHACPGRRDAYVTSGQVFALCSDTCATLRDAGYEMVTLSTRCEE